MSGKGTSFGAFLDSTLDRMEEGIVLTAVAYQFSEAGNDAAVAAVVVAVLASLMVSYTRARAEALGVECKVGIADRAVRVVILSAGLVLAKGAAILDVELLEPAVWVLAGLSVITVGQRIFHVRTELRRRPPRCNADLPAGVFLDRFTSDTRYENLKAEQRHGALPGGEGPRRHHRRRQLRLVLRPGRPVLQGRRSRRAGPGPHARRPRRLPRPRHRVLRPRSTSTPRRSARTSPRRSSPARTTR